MLSVAALLVTVAMTGVPDQVFFGGMEAGACPRRTHSVERRSLRFHGHDRGRRRHAIRESLGPHQRNRSAGRVAGVAGSGADDRAVHAHRPTSRRRSTRRPKCRRRSRGMFVNVSYGAGPALDVSIGGLRRFFERARRVLRAGHAAVDSPMMHWRTQGPTSFFCIVAPDTDYYLNLRLSDPDDDAGSCSADSCGVTPHRTSATETRSLAARKGRAAVFPDQHQSCRFRGLTTVQQSIASCREVGGLHDDDSKPRPQRPLHRRANGWSLRSAKPPSSSTR